MDWRSGIRIGPGYAGESRQHQMRFCVVQIKSVNRSRIPSQQIFSSLYGAVAYTQPDEFWWGAVEGSVVGSLSLSKLSHSR